jgi:hypothetical protein
MTINNLTFRSEAEHYEKRQCKLEVCNVYVCMYLLCMHACVCLRFIIDKQNISSCSECMYT